MLSISLILLTTLLAIISGKYIGNALVRRYGLKINPYIMALLLVMFLLIDLKENDLFLLLFIILSVILFTISFVPIFNGKLVSVSPVTAITVVFWVHKFVETSIVTYYTWDLSSNYEWFVLGVYLIHTFLEIFTFKSFVK